jgi:hypothetical protein
MNNKIFNMKATEYGITPLPDDPQVTMAYVPYQIDGSEKIYSVEKGICMGTMFPTLNKPFQPNNIKGDDDK